MGELSTSEVKLLEGAIEILDFRVRQVLPDFLEVFWASGVLPVVQERLSEILDRLDPRDDA